MEVREVAHDSIHWWKDWQQREHHSWHGRSYSPHIRLYSFCNWLPFPLKGLPLVVEGYESGSRSCLTDYPVVVLWPSIGSISFTRSTGIGSTNWLAAIDWYQSPSLCPFLHGQRVMVHLLSATEARVSNYWKRRFKYLGTCLMVLADRLLGLGGSVSIHGGFSHSPRLCFVPALGLDHPSSVLPALQIMELYDLPGQRMKWNNCLSLSRPSKSVISSSSRLRFSLRCR